MRGTAMVTRAPRIRAPLPTADDPLAGRIGIPIPETATMIGTSPASVRRMITTGQLTGARIGKRPIVVHADSIRRLMAKPIDPAG